MPIYQEKRSMRLDGVVGKVTRRGRITIEFSADQWALLSPTGQYLPCLRCGVVHDVDRLVQRFTCAECRLEHHGSRA